MMSAWFGSALSVSILWSLRQKDTEVLVQKFSLQLITKLEVTTSSLLVLVGILMLISEPKWMQFGWLHTKTVLWFLATALSHISRRTLRNLLAGKSELSRRYVVLRWFLLLCLVIAVVLAFFKPF
jgi:uncharacterized membrane protein